MRVLRVQGSTSVQYGSMERYLVASARAARARCGAVTVAFTEPPASEAFARDLASAGAACVTLPEGPGLPVKLARLLSSRRPDVLHSYFSPTSHVAMVVGWLARVPARVRTSPNTPSLVMRAAGRGGFVPMTALSARLRLSAFCSSAVIALSEAAREDLVSLGVPARRVRVIPGGVDTDVFAPPSPSLRAERRSALSLRGFTFVTVSRLVPIKRVTSVVRASGRLAAEGLSNTLLVVGDGPCRAECEREARETGADARFVGRVADVLPLLQAADAFVLFSASEGMASALAEAMAVGLPCVVSDIEPNTLLLGDGGLVARTEEELASHMKRLLKVGAGGTSRRRERVAGSLARRVEREFALYEELLGRVVETA